MIQTDKEVDLIYEYCDQGSLNEAKARRLFSEPEALKVLYELC